MCGIAGFLRTKDTRCVADFGGQDRLAAMLHGIQHRGPDDWAITFFGLNPEGLRANNGHVKWLASPDVSLALGHQRLSILDLSRDGRQPMLSRDGAYCITFNGEIYNYIELREDLVRAGRVSHQNRHGSSPGGVQTMGHRNADAPRRHVRFCALGRTRKEARVRARCYGNQALLLRESERNLLLWLRAQSHPCRLGLKGDVDSARVAEFIVSVFLITITARATEKFASSRAVILSKRILTVRSQSPAHFGSPPKNL